MNSISGILFILMPLMGSVLLAYGIFQAVLDLRTNKSRKIIQRLKEGPGQSQHERRLKESIIRKRAGELQGGVLDGLLSRMQIVAKMQRVLDQADVDWSASKLLVNLSLISLVVAAAMLFLRMSPVSSLAAGAGTLMLPVMYLIRKRKKRIRRIMEQLPDVFDLMGQALKAGHSLASAVQLVSEQLPDPIAKEFAQVFHEQNLGIKIEDALLNMANRIDQMDVRFFVTAVLIQRQTGGDLAEVLEKIGKVIRDRIQLFGMVQALTAEGRLSGWVLLILPVLVFCASLVVNPDYAKTLLNTPNGRMMLGAAIAMDLMGMAMIKKIVNIKV
ncbi:MAG: type II secretion system F family protein [Planctomycetes bacterium]|nr:type II secretion system F family protein [Planctomycetota bacterium]